MRIMITGFGPFLEHSVNLSDEMLTLLKEDPGLAQHEIETVKLPVEFGRAFEVYESHRRIFKPDLVFQLGLAAGRTRIGLEKVGLNWVETLSPDNSGKVPREGEILPGQAAAIFSSMPWTTYLRENPNPHVEVSFSAGTYVCNDLYFRSLCEMTQLKDYPPVVGFIHLPPESKQLSIHDMQQFVASLILKIVSLRS